MILILNFKKYKKPAELANKLKKFKVIIAALPKDIKQIAKIQANVYSQYINGKETAESIKDKGAKGTLLNHSDYPISNLKLKKYISLAKKQKLKTIACCTNAKRASQIALMKPDYIAVEPRELIGGKVSVSQAKPSLITDTVNAVNKIAAKRHSKIPVLCGAGIHSKKDVSMAVKLGVKGVLVSSAVVKAKRPERVLRELIDGL